MSAILDSIMKITPLQISDFQNVQYMIYVVTYNQ